MAVTIERCDGDTRAEAILELFLRNSRPDFRAVYARAYPWWMARGGSSWVGLDEAGRVVLHVAAFPREFGGGGAGLRGAVLGDLMADPAQRNFWAPAQLLRHAVTDLAAESVLDFLISDPTPPSAGILRAAGFRPLGMLRRWMLPLSGPYLAYGRLRSCARMLDVEHLALGDPRVDDLLHALAPATAFRVARSNADVATYVPGQNVQEAEWRLVSSEGRPVALALVSPLALQRVLMTVDLVMSDGPVSLASVVHAIARDARARGFRKLSLSVLDESRAAAELARAGFLRRADAQPFVIRPLRTGLALPPVDRWWLSPLDGSAW